MKLFSNQMRINQSSEEEEDAEKNPEVSENAPDTDILANVDPECNEEEEDAEDTTSEISENAPKTSVQTYTETVSELFKSNEAKTNISDTSKEIDFESNISKLET